jgi:predicted TPR repeat methyltransferase
LKWGKSDQALPALQKAAQLDPGNHSARYMAAVLSGENPKSAPPEYVKELFNQYSNRFDNHLTRQLSYKTPQLPRNALDEEIGNPKKFEKVLDLGCGTGLAGEVFRDVAGHMSGVDISGT